MKLVEVIQPTPEVIRFFLEPRLQAGNFVLSLLHYLGKEKANNFSSVNSYLESSLGDAYNVLEEISAFQNRLEQSASRGPDGTLDAAFEDLKAKAQSSLLDLHRAKIKLNDLKAALCRFIIAYESPSKPPSRPNHSIEEWMDAATLAEMRLTRGMAPDGDRNLQKLLGLFMTFRSIVCSYDGPSMYIRQIENSLASLDAIYDKLRLEMEVRKAKRVLVATRQELSTAKINLSSLRNELAEKQYKEEQLAKLVKLQEKPALPPLAIIGLFIVALSGALAFYLFSNLQGGKHGGQMDITQKSCRDIDAQLQKSPRYKGQVLIFRKFGNDIYFRANAMTCEKLHRLDSMQLASLAGILKIDYDAGNQAVASYNGNRVLQVQDLGINKLMVKLENRTDKDMNFKLKVLEKATTLRAVLQPDKDGVAEDLLMVDLTLKHAASE